MIRKDEFDKIWKKITNRIIFIILFGLSIAVYNFFSIEEKYNDCKSIIYFLILLFSFSIAFYFLAKFIKNIIWKLYGE